MSSTEYPNLILSSDGSTRKKVNVQTQKTTSTGNKNSPQGTTIANYEIGSDPFKSSAPKVDVTTPKDFIEKCLQEHNNYRAKHHSPALVLNHELCKIAQAWANTIAQKDRMYHSTSGFGENIYWSTVDVDGERAVQLWYSEIKDYNWKKNESQKGTGHFTQVIWKRTKEMGVAAAKAKSGNLYVVAEYNPPGNFVGRYTENVLPAK